MLVFNDLTCIYHFAEERHAQIITGCYFLMFSRRYFKDMPQIALDKKSNFEYIE